MSRRGLTLAEVLVIVVVVLVLAMMVIFTTFFILPRSRRVACMNNLREIGKGLVMYSGDFGGYYPTVRGPGGESRPMASLPLLYDRYVSSKKVFCCPSTKDNCDDLMPGRTFQPQVGKNDRRQCSYAYDDTRGPGTSPDIVIAGDAPPTLTRTFRRSLRSFGCAPRFRPEGFSKNNSNNHRGTGQNVLMFGGDTVTWIPTTINPLIPGDDIYTAADPKNPGASDSYIHQ